MDKDFRYITAAQYAKHIGRTPQQVYNMIHGGSLIAEKYVRGSKVGWLIPKPEDYSES